MKSLGFILIALLAAAAGGASTTLTIPANLPAGQYYIKIFAHDSSSDFVGSAPLTVK